MRSVRQLTALTAIALIAAACLAASAQAGSPLIIPQTNYQGYPAGTTQHLSPPEKSEDYQYYPQQGLNFVGGLSFSF